MSSEATKIASFITELRKKRGLTQAELAEQLGTSQSAVNRMESGKQNLSMEMLHKLSTALNREIITLSQGYASFQIEGGYKLHGSIETKVSKNAAVGLLCASLLNSSTTTLQRIPRIEEVFRIIEVLKSIGVSVSWHGEDLKIKPPKRLRLSRIDKTAASRTRSIIMFLGPLIHLFDEFTLPPPGGCKLGSRTVRPHVYGLENFGVKVRNDENEWHVTVGRRAKDVQMVMYESGDTTTENVIMAAAKTEGITTIKMASANYAVQDLCCFLQLLGVQIEGIGTTTLRVHGKTEINQPVAYAPSEDPIESMLFLSVAATTKSSIAIKRCPIDFLELELLKLKKMGLKYTVSEPYKAHNGYTNLVDIKTEPSDLVALDDKIHPDPFPGLNSDNLPFFVPIATQAKGRTFIFDWMYDNRAIYFPELNKLGASITLGDMHRVYIEGPTPLGPADVVCPPALRPSAIILIAMLAAKGTSMLRNVYSINRGYEDLANRLNGLGAHISVVHDV